MLDKPDLLTPVEAAMRLRTSTKTLQTWRQSGFGPAFVRVGLRRVFYRVAAVEDWLRHNTELADA